MLRNGSLYYVALKEELEENFMKFVEEMKYSVQEKWPIFHDFSFYNQIFEGEIGSYKN